MLNTSSEISSTLSVSEDVAVSPEKRPHPIRTLVKVVLVIGLLYVLFQKGFLSIQATQRAFTQWKNILPAFGALVLTSFFGVIRWNWLLKAQGIHLPFFRVFQLTYIGNFFNIALPGAVSGDLIKAIYIGRELPGRRSWVFGSILFDRVVGLSALAMVSAGAFIFSQDLAKISPLLFALKFVIIFSATLAILFFVYLFLVGEQHDPLLFLLKKLQNRFSRAGSFTRMYEGMRHFHHHRVVVLKVLFLSLVIHLIVGWAALNFALALGDMQVQLMQTYIVVPLGLLVTAVPVLPAGVGTGHAAFSYLFHLMGSLRGADVYTLFAFINIIVGAFGGVIYLRFRTYLLVRN